ncbi:MAG: 50S ribosomal protein L22 [Rhodobacteraceae bacterium]|nr:50S ribosomal protein L22 [Paracoccaceae bacterium]MCY4251252.1 50S ribosomal protein L22 [Paracoccaceae bacterium]MCY4307551.1 50S ribosomal protein L22 [Paracoccaceae bacterium]
MANIQKTLPLSQVVATGRMLRVSPQKLNLVAALIRGKDIADAINILTFSEKRIARDVLKVLRTAMHNAENNFGMDGSSLQVAEAYVGKNLSMKRFRARARGRANRIVKPFSQITIIVQETAD